MPIPCSRAWRSSPPDGSVKLGFRAHYPQLETKLTVRGADMDDIRKKLAPVEAEVRKRLGNFILAEDDQTLEGVVLAELEKRHATLAIVETFTERADRRAHRAAAGRGKVSCAAAIVARDLGEVCAAVGLDGVPTASGISVETAEAVARAARAPDGRHPRAGRADRSRRGRGPHRVRRHDLPRDRDRRPASPRAAAASSAAANGCASARSKWASTACAATAGTAGQRAHRFRGAAGASGRAKS